MAYPATFGDVRTAVINKLRLDATNDLTKVSDWVNQVYAMVCVETEAVQTVATMTLTAATGSYTLPTGIVRVKGMQIAPVGQNSKNAPLRVVSLEQIMQMRAGGSPTDGGTPTSYAVTGYNGLEVFPTPQAADVITVYYVAQPTALSSASDVSVLQEPYSSKLLEYGALAEAADFLHHPSEQEYRQLFEGWMQRFRAHLRRKAGAGTLQFRVVGTSPYVPHDRSTDVAVW